MVQAPYVVVQNWDLSQLRPLSTAVSTALEYFAGFLYPPVFDLDIALVKWVLK